MALGFIVLACFQALCLQNVYSSCIPNVVTETCVQSPVLVNQPSIIQPNYLTAAPCEIDFIGQYAVPALPVCPGATIIQDGSVANNLANALQLLIVSNLLSNTLPNTEVLNLVQPAVQFAQPAVQFAQPALQFATGCGCGCGCGRGCGCGFGCGCGCNGLNFVL